MNAPELPLREIGRNVADRAEMNLVRIAKLLQIAAVAEQFADRPGGQFAKDGPEREPGALDKIALPLKFGLGKLQQRAGHAEDLFIQGMRSAYTQGNSPYRYRNLFAPL